MSKPQAVIFEDLSHGTPNFPYSTWWSVESDRYSVWLERVWFERL